MEIVSHFEPLFEPSRYKVCHGGRGSGKSTSIAQALIVMSVQRKMRILCTREFQSSIKDSVLKLLSDIIYKNNLDYFFKITREGIVGRNGSQFIFLGLKHSPQSIKSLEGVDIAWLEEAQAISNDSLDILIPTIRKENSEIWMSLNPNLATDPIYTRFIENKHPDQWTLNINYDKNPFFPETLRKEMEYQKEVDYNDYLNIWKGKCKTASDAQIFKGKTIVENFDTPTDAVHYYGLDWGFSQDPTAVISCFILDKELYIDYEAGGLGVELDHTHRLIDSIPGAKENVIRADSARPESISYVKRQGYRIESVYKWSGSIEDGIAFIKSFKKIHIHTRCMKVAEEFVQYSYKIDRLTGDITTIIVDKHNHYIDSCRYALQPLIKRRGDIGMIRTIGA